MALSSVSNHEILPVMTGIILSREIVAYDLSLL